MSLFFLHKKSHFNVPFMPTICWTSQRLDISWSLIHFAYYNNVIKILLGGMDGPYIKTTVLFLSRKQSTLLLSK